MLGFVHKGTFYGPNPYSREPVVIVDLAVPETLASRGEAIESRITALHGWTRTEPLPDVAVDEAERIARLVVHWAFAALNHTRGYLHAFGWSWYVFNLADAWIVAGVAGLLYDSFTSGSD